MRNIVPEMWSTRRRTESERSASGSLHPGEVRAPGESLGFTPINQRTNARPNPCPGSKGEKEGSNHSGKPPGMAYIQFYSDQRHCLKKVGHKVKVRLL